MYLEKIEIQGFKSFAKKTTIHFPKETIRNKGITAIVGPNGSGKSNIADAIRWVLGEQSVKTLRAKKSEDVIFSGSDKKARLGFAEVSLFLNNESGRAPIDYSEIGITRRLYRNGESEYLLNKNKVRLSDIQMLLAKAQIGQRTYSVIGQGMIDYFLIAPPNERKEFFDEAAGVKEYQIKRNFSLNKLILSHDNLTKADILIKEIEPRLKSLTRQVKKLEKREALLKELRNLQKSYFGSIKEKFDDQENILRNELESLEKKHNELEDKIKKTEEEMQNLKGEESRNEIFNKLKDKYNSLIEEKNLLLRKQTVIKADKEVEYKKIGKIDLVWMERKKDEIKKESEQISINLSSLSSSIKTLNEKIKNISDEKKEIDKEKNKIEQALNDLQLKIFPKALDSAKLKEDISEIYKEYENLLNLFDTIKDISEFEKIKQDAKIIRIKFTEIISKISEEKEEVRGELDELKEKLSEILGKKEKIIVNYNNALLEINGKKEREMFLTESFKKIKSEEESLEKEILNAEKGSPNNADKLKQLEDENKKIEGELDIINKKINEISSEIDGFNKKEEEKKEKLFTLQREYQEKQRVINKFSEEINFLRINLAKVEKKKEDLEQEMKNEEIIVDENFERNDNPENLISEINKIKSRLEIIGGIDPETEKEYTETKERYEFLSTQVNDLKRAISSLEKVIAELDETIKHKFEKAFNEINTEFQKYFKILFKGGNAKLLKIEEAIEEKTDDQKDADETGENDELTPLSPPQNCEAGQAMDGLKEDTAQNNPLKKYKQKVIFGIEIQATPPGKKVASINMLSGGERALTSIALICAIISNNPAPFIVLDEVDAALDEANSFKLSNILDELSHRSQFIVITHNRATMHKAELLYGVAMGDDGVSKLLSIKFEEAANAVKR